MIERLPKPFGPTAFFAGLVGALALAIVIGGTGTLAQTAHAAGTTIYVDAANCPGGAGTSADPFCSFDDALAAAASGDTIKIARGVYPAGAPQVAITEDVTIEGSGARRTTLVPTADTTTSGNGRGWFFQPTGTKLTLKKLTMDGTGFKIWQAIRSLGSLDIDRVAFTEIKFNESGPHYAGTAIASFGTDPGLDLRLRHSSFSQIGRIGALVFGVEAVIERNTYTGKGDGDFLDYFIDLSAGATATITKNAIRDNRGVASVDGSTSAGILATTFFDPGTTGVVADNKIHKNTTGIFIGFAAADTTVLTVEHNELRANGVGIRVVADGSIIRNNEIEDSTDDGIRASGSGNSFLGNDIEDSGGFDCADISVGAGTAGTANVWADNDAETSSPAGLCGDDDDD